MILVTHRLSFQTGLTDQYMIYLLTAIGQPPGGSSTVHIYTQTIQRTTQITNLQECGPCPVSANFTLAFALQLRTIHGKSSVRVVIHKHTMRIHGYNNKIHKLHYQIGIKPYIYIDKNQNLKNMKECHNSTRKIHISSNFILSISLLIMFDTL